MRLNHPQTVAMRIDDWNSLSEVELEILLGCLLCGMVTVNFEPPYAQKPLLNRDIEPKFISFNRSELVFEVVSRGSPAAAGN